MRILNFTLLACLLSVCAGAEPSADEQAVWDLELTYWEYVKNKDIEGYLTLWDDRFVGWPGFSETPVGKDEIAEWITPLHINPGESYDYELTHQAVRSFGNVVVVHYLVRDFMRSVETDEVVRPLDTYRITHTWQKSGGSWKIITGMSSPQATKED